MKALIYSTHFICKSNIALQTWSVSVEQPMRCHAQQVIAMFALLSVCSGIDLGWMVGQLG